MALWLAACSDSSEPLGPEPPTGNPNAALECERVGYPCSLAGMSTAVLRRSEALADSAAAMMRSGVPTVQVGTWLAQREGVAAVQRGYRALQFRVRGGAPVWVIDDKLNLGGDGSTGGAAGYRSGRGAGVRSAVRADVVGDSSEVKRALVLSPFAWQFGGFDESAAVAAILDGARGYEGRVQLIEVAAQSSAPIPLSVYTTWNLFDVVHVSSHGATVCEGGACHATLTIAIDNRPIDQVTADWNDTGVTFTVGAESGNRYVSLTADFFSKHYPGGVGNVLVFLNACETLTTGATDLANAIRGSKGVYVGWSAAVPSGNAGEAAEAFYTRLSAGGVTVGTAYADLGDLKTVQWTDDEGTTLSPTLRVTERAEGGDLRIRDIVWLENPAGGVPLEDGALIGVSGVPGDGSADTVPYRIRIDGVDAPPAGFTVRVAIDGVAAAPATLAGAQAAGAMTWLVTGRLALGRDLQDGDTVEIRASVELPDRGTSEARAVVGVRGDPGYWVGKAVFVREAGEDSREVAEANNLRFDYNPDLDSYTLTHGTLTWTQVGRTFNAQGQICEYQLAPTTITLAPGSAQLSISYGTSPARYAVYGEHEGATFTIPTSCANLNLPVKFHGAWLRSSNGVNEVSADGNSIDGYFIQDFGFLWEGWAWELERRTF